MIGIDVMIGDYVMHSRYLYIKVASITKKKNRFPSQSGRVTYALCTLVRSFSHSHRR